MPCPADMHLLLKYIHRSPRPSSVHCCSTGFAVLCTSLPSHCEAPGAARLISLAARNLVTPIRSAHCAAAQHGPALCGAVAMDCPPAWRFPAAAPAEYLGPALAQAAPLLAHPAASWCTLPSPSATAQGRHRHQWAVRPRRRSFRRTCPGDRGVPPSATCTVDTGPPDSAPPASDLEHRSLVEAIRELDPGCRRRPSRATPHARSRAGRRGRQHGGVTWKALARASAPTGFTILRLQ